MKFVLIFIVIFIIGCNNNQNKANNNIPNPPLAGVKPKPEPVETKKEYAATTKEFSYTRNGKGVYLKEFIKNPDKYIGERVKISVKVFDIQERNGVTVMQVFLDRQYDVAVVAYNGTAKIYNGDVVSIFGEIAGSVTGTNKMGAEVTLPSILAKHIGKIVPEGGDD